MTIYNRDSGSIIRCVLTVFDFQYGNFLVFVALKSVTVNFIRVFFFFFFKVMLCDLVILFV